MEPDERRVRLRDREVLVVSRIRDDRLPDRSPGRQPRQVGAWRPTLCGTRLQVQAVGLVERGRERILRAVAVQRVEVELGRARLQERRRRDIGALHQRALVEGQVVIEELAEVRKPGRDLPRREAVDRHRGGDLSPVGLTELSPSPLWPHT